MNETNNLVVTTIQYCINLLQYRAPDVDKWITLKGMCLWFVSNCEGWLPAILSVFNACLQGFHSGNCHKWRFSIYSCLYII